MEEKQEIVSTEILGNPVNDTLRRMMLINIHDARLIYSMAESYGCLDSQEFINWQDELNAISIKYKQ